MSFAENLNKICHAKGTTVSGVLKEMGVSTSKVTLWNNGSLPKEEMLLRLSQVLKCSVMDFFYDGDIVPSPQPVLTLDEDEEVIIRLFRKLSLKDKHIFMARVYDYEDKLTKE